MKVSVIESDSAFETFLRSANHSIRVQGFVSLLTIPLRNGCIRLHLPALSYCMTGSAVARTPPLSFCQSQT